jgi:hypothetical protein
LWWFTCCTVITGFTIFFHKVFHPWPIKRKFNKKASQSWKYWLINLYVGLEPPCSFILTKELISSQMLSKPFCETITNSKYILISFSDFAKRPYNIYWYTFHWLSDNIATQWSLVLCLWWFTCCTVITGFTIF